MERLQLSLKDVPKTLLLPLWGRAQMSRTGKHILSDPTAIEIVSKLDVDFSLIDADLDTSKNLSWIARARQIDDRVVEFAGRHPQALVINIGAGLDTTFSRVDNGLMRWITIDLPEVIEIRGQLIPAREREEIIEGSIFDPATLDNIESRGRPILFIAGGVFFYFEESNLRTLFVELGRRFPGAEIVFDAFTPAGVRKANEMLKRVEMGDSPLQWGTESAKAIEQWCPTLEVLDQYEYFRGLDLRGIPLKSRIMVLFNRLLRVMTIVHARWNV